MTFEYRGVEKIERFFFFFLLELIMEVLRDYKRLNGEHSK